VAQSKAQECLQKMALNIIFPGSEYVTNVIIASVETLSLVTTTAILTSFYSDDVHERGGARPHGPLFIGL